MSYRYRATETFWKNFYDLPPKQKDTTRKVWQIFKMTLLIHDWAPIKFNGFQH